jgi:hypothetical protein
VKRKRTMSWMAFVRKEERQEGRSGRRDVLDVRNSRRIDEGRSERKRSAGKGWMTKETIGNVERKCRWSGSKEVERGCHAAGE